MTTAATTTLLDVAGVAKSYGKRQALGGVDLRIASGEFVALLGPNGAGKTTLFQLLSGLFVADGGRITIGDADISTAPSRALAQLGIVFQQPTLDLDLSVEKNLAFSARLHGLGRALLRQRIDEELAAQGLAERRRDKVRELSGGNRRKVELARALVHSPRVLLMDEATVGLDPASRRQLLEQVRELCRTRGVAVLWATHLVDEAEQANRVVVLHRGKVLADCRPAALIERVGAGSLADAFANMTGNGGEGQERSQ